MTELLILGDAVSKRYFRLLFGCEDCGCRITGYRYVCSRGNAVQFITFRIPFPDRISSGWNPGKNDVSSGGAVYQCDALIPGMGSAVDIRASDLKKEGRIPKRLIPFIDLLPDCDLYLFRRIIAGQHLRSRTVHFID